MAAVIRLAKGGAYKSDINKLRDLIRQNATLQQNRILRVTHTNVTVQLYLNMAYQANSSQPPATASLYTLGFINAAGIIYRFNIVPWAPIAVIPGAQVLANDGSYGQLGYPGAFPNNFITDANLLGAIQTLNGYAGGPLNANLLTALTKLIVTTSEATRIENVLDGVDSVLGNPPSYTPDMNQLRNWGGHVLGKKF